MSILNTIPAENQARRGWKLTIDGRTVEPVGHLILENSKFGRLEYGATPAGYDAWAFTEVGGGGSVIIPWVLFGPKLHIGMVTQDRYTMGGKVENAPRGFMKEGETHIETAQREAGEEFRFNLAERLVELPGDPTNPNSAFFVTKSDDNTKKGVRFFGLELRDGEVDRGTYMLRRDVLLPKSPTGETIFKSHFLHYLTALQSNDMFTVAGVGRLLAYVMPRLAP